MTGFTLFYKIKFKFSIETEVVLRIPAVFTYNNQYQDKRIYLPVTKLGGDDHTKQNNKISNNLNNKYKSGTWPFWEYR